MTWWESIGRPAVLLTAFALACEVCGSGGSSLGEPPELAADQLRTRLEKASTPGLQEIGGWVVATEVEASSPDQTQPPRLLRERLELLAIGRILSSRLDRDSVPDALERGPRNFLLEFGGGIALSNRVGDRFIRFPERRTSDGSWVVHVAVPERVADGWSVSAQQVFDRLRAWAGESDSSLSSPEAMLYLEMAPETEVPLAQAAVANAWTKRFGRGITETIERKPIRCLPPGYRSDFRQGSDSASTRASVDSLLFTLGQRPYDPEVLESLARALEADGWRRCAEYVRAFASIRLAKPDVRSRVEPRPGLVEADPQDATLASSRDKGDSRLQVASLLAGPTCELIIRSDGYFPFLDGAESAGSIVPSIKAFERGELLEALAGFAASIELCPDADALSYGSACLLGLQHPDEAAAFARTAYRMKARHPYAGVNLLRALRGLGERDEVARLLPEVSEVAKLDVWGVDQLRQMRAWLKATAPADLPKEVPTQP